ncbi:uncharacterized protein LOC129755102 [Uranotaenia lowii]|uniref:uncharacterized protein LOC129755102 n=1 Tax=Uranotaenia lowii TaxID=190385 RepID=UPI0024791AF9|nr:uncharacterized protein LOC129755102 [Uranotaenia lowii]
MCRGRTPKNPSKQSRVSSFAAPVAINCGRSTASVALAARCKLWLSSSTGTCEAHEVRSAVSFAVSVVASATNRERSNVLATTGTASAVASATNRNWKNVLAAAEAASAVASVTSRDRKNVLVTTRAVSAVASATNRVWKNTSVTTKAASTVVRPQPRIGGSMYCGNDHAFATRATIGSRSTTRTMERGATRMPSPVLRHAPKLEKL